jgi:hypothetical protein
MSRMQSGGGMPSMEDIMSDPSLRELFVFLNLFETPSLKDSYSATQLGAGSR